VRLARERGAGKEAGGASSTLAKDGGGGWPVRLGEVGGPYAICLFRCGWHCWRLSFFCLTLRCRGPNPPNRSQVWVPIVGVSLNSTFQ
jgi:hypothetical protein